MALFKSVGDVASARVMRDMATGRARGFGFVEMTTDEAAQKAIEKLHQHDMDGRALVVNEAQPKPAGGGRGFGGGGGGVETSRSSRGRRDDSAAAAPGAREPRGNALVARRLQLPEWKELFPADLSAAKMLPTRVAVSYR